VGGRRRMTRASAGLFGTANFWNSPSWTLFEKGAEANKPQVLVITDAAEFEGRLGSERFGLASVGGPPRSEDGGRA
jgi:hypothetical protein